MEKNVTCKGLDTVPDTQQTTPFKVNLAIIIIIIKEEEKDQNGFSFSFVLYMSFLLFLFN
jgi:hypothetical protein